MSNPSGGSDTSGRAPAPRRAARRRPPRLRARALSRAAIRREPGKRASRRASIVLRQHGDAVEERLAAGEGVGIDGDRAAGRRRAADPRHRRTSWPRSEKSAPVSATASTSTISASAAPLAPPIGCSAPLRAALASVVGLPRSSTAQPAGIGSPFWAAVRILPRATWLSARSTTIGGPLLCGAAKASGLVPNTGCRPPQGAIALGVLPKASASSPASASRSTCRPTTPK